MSVITTATEEETLLAQPDSEVASGAQPPALALNFDYLNARTLFVSPHDKLLIVVVGLGGTGSWFAPSAARIARLLANSGKQVRLMFIDHDVVEPANCLRQNFCELEVGMNKARTLALRYGRAWGVDIAAVDQKFDIENPRIDWETNGLNVVIGCVDNAAARVALAATTGRNHSRYDSYSPATPPRTFWIDCGNTVDNGQVMIGTASNYDLKLHTDAYNLPGMCVHLPSPAMQMPDLLKPRPEELTQDNLSCEQMNLLNAQSLTINQNIAGVAADYLLRLVSTNNLNKFQTFIDLASGSMRSTYITPDSVKRVLVEAGHTFTNKKSK